MIEIPTVLRATASEALKTATDEELDTEDPQKNEAEKRLGAYQLNKPDRAVAPSPKPHK